MYYRIMLDSEDGVYCLRDEYSSVEKAESVMEGLRDSYGEGQSLWIESYSA